MTPTQAPTRRERLRAQTLAEIRDHAYAQLARGGPEAVSLNGIAKAMGMSGPAMYRYFGARDDLLTMLVTDSYEQLADTLIAAAQDAVRRRPRARLRAVVAAFRDWALTAPNRYRLTFGTEYSSGALDPDRIIPAAHRTMGVLLACVADIVAAEGIEPPVVRVPLARQLTDWGRRGGTEEPVGVLLVGLLTWTRLHGILSLEIDGVFDQVGVDPERLCAVELDLLLPARHT